MKKIAIIVMLIMTELVALSQKNDKDSIVELNNLSQKYWYISLDSSLILAEKAININNNRYPNENARSMKSIGVVNYFKHQIDSALAYYELALQEYEKSSNLEGQGAILNNIAIIFQEKGEFDKALEYHLLALEIRKKTNDINAIGASFNNIGNVYASINQNQQAIKYYNNALNELKNSQDILTLADIYNNLGAAYSKLDSRKMSEKFHRKALELRKKAGYKIGEATSLMNIANTMDYKSGNVLALYQSAIHLFKSEQYVNGIALCYINIGNYYRYFDEYDSALYYYEKGNEICKKNNLLETQLEIARDIGLLYLIKKDISAYNKSLKEFNSINDSLFNQKKSKIVAELELKYKTAEKQLQIEKLEKEQEKQKTKLYKIRLFWAIASILLLTSIFAGILIFYKYRQKQKYKRQLLERQKLEFQNKVLRLQMNPHFIFNSLNSIQSYIAQNNSMQAEEYLAQFAHLMRKILDNSTKEYISLNEDIETMRTYLTLEQSRFPDKFDFEISIDEELDEEFVQVPPMLIQPFVENSIIHGFSEKNIKGLIKISFKPFKDTYIKCSIEDNGIGREKAKLKQKNKKNKSMGILVTEERLSSENKAKKATSRIKFIDLKDEKNNATGTKVELLIKIKI